MESRIHKHLLEFLVYKILTYDFNDSDCKITIQHNWTMYTHDLSRKNYKNEDEYKMALEKIFMHVYPSEIIDAFSNSYVNMELKISITQYLTSYIAIKELKDIKRLVGKVKNTGNTNQQECNEISTKISELERKIDMIDEKINLLSDMVGMANIKKID
jgi:hypothetical protein